MHGGLWKVSNFRHLQSLGKTCTNFVSPHRASITLSTAAAAEVHTQTIHGKQVSLPRLPTFLGGQLDCHMIVGLPACVLFLKHSQDNQAARAAPRCLKGKEECLCQLFEREVLQQVPQILSFTPARTARRTLRGRNVQISTRTPWSLMPNPTPATRMLGGQHLMATGFLQPSKMIDSLISSSYESYESAIFLSRCSDPHLACENFEPFRAKPSALQSQHKGSEGVRTWPGKHCGPSSGCQLVSSHHQHPLQQLQAFAQRLHSLHALTELTSIFVVSTFSI